jgi:hypothetical protein
LGLLVSGLMHGDSCAVAVSKGKQMQDQWMKKNDRVSRLVHVP